VVFDVEYTLLERLMMKPVFQRRYGAVVAILDQGLDAAWAEAFSRVLRNFERDLRVLIRGTEVCRQFTPEPGPAPAAAPPAGSDTSPGAAQEGVPAGVEDSG